MIDCINWFISMYPSSKYLIHNYWKLFALLGPSGNIKNFKLHLLDYKPTDLGITINTIASHKLECS